MNLKYTAALIAIAVVMIAFAAAVTGRLGDTAFGLVADYTPFAEREERKARDPWFYQVSFDDIIKIEVNAGDDTERFYKNDQDSWVFERLEGIPPSHTRWGGIVLLLSGPQTRRDFSTVRATIDDPAEYGLDDPKLVVKLGLTGDRELEFRLGDETTDGDHSYGQVIGFPQLFLIASIWGEVLGRLAHEPPVPKWWEYRDPSSIREVNVYLGESGETKAPYLEITQKDGVWSARTTEGTESAAYEPVDPDKWAEYTHLFGGPGEGLRVEKYRVRDRDFVDWGIEQNGHSIEIRFSGTTERGTAYTDGVLFLIGNKTDDGQRYYTTPAQDQVTTPILTIPADWADALFDLVHNVPYAEAAGGN